MKTKFSGFLTLLLALIVQFTFAQEKTITGTVSDETGPLPGVSILIKGTTTGTETDFDGKYTIQANVGDVLVFSFVGMSTQQKTVGSATTINVVLVTDNVLEEVVVTALGVERKARTLGYAVSKIKGDDLEIARESNIVNALQGKTSGVQITSQSGNLGGSSKILIRGISSLSGNNNPLWVVDGVPIFDSNIVTGSRISGGFDVGNGASDINPDDIQSITVLKGGSAAALYGSRASNGAIIVTTKKGKKGTKASISVNTSLRFDNPLKLPDFQTQYGPGDQGVYDVTQLNGWGPLITGQQEEDFDGETISLRAYPNNVKNFYQTGVQNINNFTISGASDSGEQDYRLSLSYLTQTGIAPASNLRRVNLGLNAGSKLSEKFTSRFSVNYVNSGNQGVVAQGANDPNVLTNIINFAPVTFDFNKLKPWVNPDGSQRNPLDLFTNNPYWIAYENDFNRDVNRLYGNVSLQYDYNENFNFLARAGYDFNQDQRFRNNRKGTIGRENGDFTDDQIQQKQLTVDLIATYKKNFAEDFDLILRGGYQLNQRWFNRFTNFAQNLTVDGLYDTGNAASNNPTKDFSERRLYGLYGDLTLSYKNWLSLTATARNDWSSTLPINNNSFFYPSVGLSLIFTDALKLDSNFLTYGKIRGSWANVGGDTGPYQIDFQYFPQTSWFGQFGTGGTYPFNSVLAFSGPATIPPGGSLKPENQKSYEFGTELEFFNGRISIDATYYHIVTTDQILAVAIPESTGFSFRRTNIGETSNKGIELELKTKVISTDNFSWNLSYNFTKNDFIVEELAPGVDRFVINSGFNSTQVIAEPGKSYGLYGNRFARATDSNGEIIEDAITVDPNTGLRTQGDNARLGNILPDYTMGLTSQFSYKNISLSATIDLREGGVVFSNTVGGLRRNGLSSETINRDVFIDQGAVIQDTPGGPTRPNDVPVQSVQDYWGQYASSSIAEGNLFDASFIKLREIGLSYTFSNKILDKTPFGGLSIGLEARNVAILKSNVPDIDPETNLFGSANDGAGVERGSLPSTRSIGFNVKFKF